MTALHGAQGIRVLGRTLRVERAKAHRVILLEPREGATFVPSTIGGWLVRTSTGDFVRLARLPQYTSCARRLT